MNFQNISLFHAVSHLMQLPEADSQRALYRVRSAGIFGFISQTFSAVNCEVVKETKFDAHKAKQVFKPTLLNRLKPLDSH